jgi:hypothetical protein
MTQQPPIPAANQSPYPIDEPPHVAEALGYQASDLELEGYDAGDKGEGFSLTGLLDDYGIDARTAIGIGAAVGIGAIAGISALFFSGRGKRSGAKTVRASGTRKAPARTAATRKPRTAKPRTTKPRTTKTAAARKPASKTTAASQN